MAIEELQNGRYRHLRLLGSGGMGEVYLMQDTRVNRQVAIKVLRAEVTLYPDDEKFANSARLFEREARAIAALDHPNILPLYDFGEEAREDITVTYMVMPYCGDGSLEGWLRQRGSEPFLPQQVAALIEQAAEALHYAHEHKVIHLDVKPSNFLIRSNRKDPQRPTLLLADFGIARNFTTVSSSSRTIRGTPTAMSPEQWSGEPVLASDQYALAIMAYEMLVGRPPFIGSLEQLMYRHFTVQAPRPSSFNPLLPLALDEVLLRALSKKPEERFPTIVDFANALTEAAEQPPAYTEEELAGSATLTLSQAEAEAGSSRLLTLSNGREVSVAVPAGAYDGQVLRLPGPASDSGETGDVLVNIAVQQSEASRSSGMASFGQAMETPQAQLVQEARAVQAAPVPPKRAVPLSPIPAIASEHEQPTLMNAESKQEITQAPLPVVRPRQRIGVLALVSLLIVLLLLTGSIYAFASHRTPTNNGQSTRVASLTPTSTPTPTPTPAPGLYIAGLYNGTMANSTTGQTDTLSLNLVQTNGRGAVTGSATFNSSAQQRYLLQGAVDLQGSFTFTVRQPAGQLPLILYGSVQQGVYLHGQYCHAAAAPCQAPEGYFTVGPRS